jgi:hypothetical protein
MLSRAMEDVEGIMGGEALSTLNESLEWFSLN